ncbi:MAG TPA: gamma-glutamyltransferase, partial [Phnomibacter sp.]|nr:gamma-glutamyltransferase [Phnomibacter sp.]
MKPVLPILLFTSLTLQQVRAQLPTINATQYATVKTAEYPKAAVACAHPLASEVGAFVLKLGGNAV